MATDYLIEWHRIRKAEYIAILVTDSQGALVLSSTPQAAYDQSKALWWKAAFNGGKGQIYVSDLQSGGWFRYYCLVLPQAHGLRAERLMQRSAGRGLLLLLRCCGIQVIHFYRSAVCRQGSIE